MKRTSFPRHPGRSSRRRNHIHPGTGGDLAQEHRDNPADTSEIAPMDETSERPTTFQLAQLAATLATRPDSIRIPPADVVLEAIQLWDAAVKVKLTERQAKDIWAALYTDTKPEWDQRLQDYVGDKFALYELLSDPRFQVETDILPNLFPNEDETPESRRQKFADLIRFAQTNEFFSTVSNVLHPDAKNLELHEGAQQLQETTTGEELLGGKLNALAIRMLVEAHQAGALETAGA